MWWSRDRSKDARIGNVLFDAALEFGKNWRWEVRSLAAERLPDRDEGERASLAWEVEATASLLSSGLGTGGRPVAVNGASLMRRQHEGRPCGVSVDGQADPLPRRQPGHPLRLAWMNADAVLRVSHGQSRRASVCRPELSA